MIQHSWVLLPLEPHFITTRSVTGLTKKLGWVIQLLQLGLLEVLHAKNWVTISSVLAFFDVLNRHHAGPTDTDIRSLAKRSELDSCLVVDLAVNVWAVHDVVIVVQLH